MTTSNLNRSCNVCLPFFGNYWALQLQADNWADAADAVRFAIRYCAPDYAAKVEKWLEETRATIARDNHVSGCSTQHAGKGFSWQRGPVDDWSRDLTARCADLPRFPGMDYKEQCLPLEAHA